MTVMRFAAEFGIEHPRTETRARRRAAVALLAAAVATAPIVAEVPIPVSPGSPGGDVTVPGHCPTFSWAPNGHAEAYEVRLFRRPPSALAGDESAVDGGARPVLTARVPGSASSWTPAEPHCLEEGAGYSWSVATVSGGELVGDYSPHLSFRVGTALSPRVTERILDLLEEWLTDGAIEPIAAAELLRALGLGELDATTSVSGAGAAAPEVIEEPPLRAAAESLALPFPTAATTVGLSSTLDTFLYADNVAAAIQGITSGLAFQDPVEAIGVLGVASCSGICDGGGVVGRSTSISLPGVRGDGERYGVRGTGRFGVQGMSADSLGAGGDFYNALGSGVRVEGSGAARDLAALWVNSLNTTQGMAAYMTNGSAFATAHLANSGGGQVLYLQNGGTGDSGSGGGNFIEARNKSEGDIQFRVASDGTAYSDTSFVGGGADFAEMMPAVPGLEPGEVVAARADGLVDRAGRAFETSIVGVVSAAPGFVGGHGAGDSADGKVAVAIVGIVPVLASAENGPIVPGDLLVAAATAGRAMRGGEAPPRGSVLGKALSGLTEGVGTVRLLVMAQ